MLVLLFVAPLKKIFFFCIYICTIYNKKIVAIQTRREKNYRKKVSFIKFICVHVPISRNICILFIFIDGEKKNIQFRI